MIRIENKQVAFTRPGAPKDVLLRRDAQFVHTCPRCANVIHGLLLHDREVETPAFFRTGKHPLQLNLKLFTEGTSEFMIPPVYSDSIIDLGERMVGQYFFDTYHFSNYGYKYVGRCKYSRAVYQFEDNVTIEAVRLMGVLRALYGGEDALWKMALARVNENPAVAEIVKTTIRATCGVAADRMEAAQPVLLLSKEDWDLSMFHALLKEAVATAEATKEE